MKAPKPASDFSREFSLPQSPRLDSWADADTALAELGKLEHTQAHLERERVQALARLEARADRLHERATRLARALEAFCRAQTVEGTDRNGHPAALLATGRRSRRLVFGRVGFHRVHWLAVANAARAVARLAQNGLGTRFLRVERQLDREALHRALLASPAASHRRARFGRARSLARELARAGIRLETRDAWFYEIHRAAVARWS